MPRALHCTTVYHYGGGTMLVFRQKNGSHPAIWQKVGFEECLTDTCPINLLSEPAGFKF